MIHEHYSGQLVSPILHLKLIFPCLCCLDRQVVWHIHLQTPSEAHLTLLWIKHLLQVPVWDTLHTEIHKNILLLGHKHNLAYLRDFWMLVPKPFIILHRVLVQLINSICNLARLKKQTYSPQQQTHGLHVHTQLRRMKKNIFANDALTKLFCLLNAMQPT